jgi:hypothetical protein
MRHLIVCFFVALVLQPAAVVVANAEDSPKVFMFVRDGSRDLELMLSQEVGVMTRMIEDAGYSVDIATTSGEPMTIGTITLTPTISLADVEVNDYVGVILPCMAPERGSTMPAKVATIIEQAVLQGKPIAASRGSVVELAMAGGIDDRQYAFAAAVDVDKRPEFARGTFLGTGVVRDTNISTSGICPLAARSLDLPDGTVGLTQSFIESLSEAG